MTNEKTKREIEKAIKNASFLMERGTTNLLKAKGAGKKYGLLVGKTIFEVSETLSAAQVNVDTAIRTITEYVNNANDAITKSYELGKILGLQLAIYLIEKYN